jgi:hypothetical protein
MVRFSCGVDNEFSVAAYSENDQFTSHISKVVIPAQAGIQVFFSMRNQPGYPLEFILSNVEGRV